MGKSQSLCRVFVNDRLLETAAGTLSTLLEELELDATTVVAEVNTAIIAQDAFATTHLQSGDRIELVRFVGGG